MHQLVNDLPSRCFQCAERDGILEKDQIKDCALI
jgi:hypothetical protein